MEIERILLLGASGQLGTAIQERFKDKIIITPTHVELDLLWDSFAEEFQRILEVSRPHLVINCAAMHNVAECEKNPLAAWRVNGKAVHSMSHWCEQYQIPFAHISTDYVFPGRDDPYIPSDTPSPLNIYGMSKYCGEFPLYDKHGFYIFRIAGLYGPSGMSGKGPHFLERVLRAAETGESFRAVDDVFFSPSYAPHVAACMRMIIEEEKYGIHHVAGSYCVSWFEFAKYARWYAFSQGKLSAMGELVPCKLAEMNESFQRPMRVDLETGRMLHWQRGVEEYVEHRFRKLLEQRFKDSSSR